MGEEVDGGPSVDALAGAVIGVLNIAIKLNKLPLYYRAAIKYFTLSIFAQYFFLWDIM